MSDREIKCPGCQQWLPVEFIPPVTLTDHFESTAHNLSGTAMMRAVVAAMSDLQVRTAAVSS